jgi:2-keto-4-pentenoate hydratase/2-oxohepta-3-ene-1,7-dioic acid hydratase in catechol pathway
MKLVTIDAREVAGRPGILLDGGIILDLSAAPGSLSASQWVPQSTISILAAGERGLKHAASLANQADEQAERMRENGALLKLSSTALLAPMRRPGLILVSHVLGDGSAVSFIKSPNTAVGHASVVAMHGQEKLVANPMFAAVLSKPLYQANAEAAEKAISAWTLAVDLSPEQAEPRNADDWRSYVAARQFPGSLPIGPALITVDELQNPGATQAAVRINGVETWQGMICPPTVDCVRTLAKLSQNYAFSPGDVIAFATAHDSPSSPRQQLRAGDVFSVSAKRVMELGFQLRK